MNIDISMAENVLVLRNKFFVTPIATLGRITNVSLGQSTDANGSYLQNEIGLLSGSYDPAEITILPP